MHHPIAYIYIIPISINSLYFGSSFLVASFLLKADIFSICICIWHMYHNYELDYSNHRLFIAIFQNLKLLISSKSKHFHYLRKKINQHEVKCEISKSRWFTPNFNKNFQSNRIQTHQIFKSINSPICGESQIHKLTWLKPLKLSTKITSPSLSPFTYHSSPHT